MGWIQNAFFSTQSVVNIWRLLIEHFAFVITFQTGLLPQCSFHSTEIREKLVGLAKMQQIPKLQTGSVHNNHQVIHPSVFSFFPCRQCTSSRFQILFVINSEPFKFLIVLNDAVHVQNENDLRGFHRKFLLCQSEQLLYALFLRQVKLDGSLFHGHIRVMLLDRFQVPFFILAINDHGNGLLRTASIDFSHDSFVWLSET